MGFFCLFQKFQKERRKKMSMIKITFPDGAVKEFPKGITVKEVAEALAKV